MSNCGNLFFLLLVLLLAGCNSGNEQKAVPSAATDVPEVPKPVIFKQDTSVILKSLVDKHFASWQLLEYQSGDLNKDDKADLVLILEKNCPEDEAVSEDSKCRKAVLLQNKNFPHFDIVAANDYVVDCSDCGGAGSGDPHRGIAIKNGYISFESLYGSCDKTVQVITFRYDAGMKDWLLYKIGTEDYRCPREEDEEEVEVVKQTKTKADFGKVRFEEFDGV